MSKPPLPALLLALASSTAFGAGAQKQCYSARDEIFAGKQSLGFYEASANVTSNEGSTFVAFWVSMPDSGQVLGDSKIPAKIDAAGKYTFRFIDGWNNKGRGSLVVSGKRATLTLEEEEVAEGGNNILRNYGTHKLTQSACK